MHNSAAARGAAAADYSALIDADLSWADIERFVARSPLPVLVKGVMTAEDAGWPSTMESPA